MPLVSSSAIDRIDYDPSRRLLSIWFRETGGPYGYHEVPPQVFEGFLRADSKGAYFNDHIRDRYRFDPPRDAGGRRIGPARRRLR